MEYHYETCCVHSTAKLITEMVDRAREVTWRTFRKHVPLDEIKQAFPSYSYRRERYNPDTGELTAPMHIKDDYAVSFWKSRYDGQPCYYLVHSSIEYIWTADDED